jgi:hypothetical protein
MTDPNDATLRKAYRLILKLGKFQVLERGHLTMKISLGGSTTMTITDPILANADVKAGDILTLYTEVLYANPKPSSVN